MILRLCLRPARIAALLGTIALSGLAHGQTGTMPAGEEDPTREASRQHFQHGLALANSHDWERALVAFLESRKLFPTRSATRNAAIALRQLGRHREAVELYDALLAEFGGSMTSEMQGSFQAERRAALERVGELDVSVDQPGAAIVVDGQQRGLAPLQAPLQLDGGVHMLRLSKPGFEPWERRVTIVGGDRQQLQVRLKPQVGTGTLVVREQNGETLDVVLDAVVVGRAPFEGNVSTGLHSVLLRGPGRGTQPISVKVTLRETSTLTLKAVPLDAEVVLRPRPVDASVFVDGVFAGNGAWMGLLPSGQHRFEVVAPGHLPFRKDLRLAPGKRADIVAKLDQSPPHLDKAAAALARFYVEPVLGLLMAHSLAGDADAACGCDERSRPFGWSGLVRLGYSALPTLGVEVAAGYLSLAEDMTRHMLAHGEPGSSPFLSTDYRDSTDLNGPLVGVALSTRFFQRLPLTARLMTGVAVLSARNSGSGTFSGMLTEGEPSSAVDGTLEIQEPRHLLPTPFISTELHLGYGLTTRLTLDLGVALYLFLPGGVARTERAGLLDGRTTSGVLWLDDETIARPFLALSPTLGARIAF